MCMWYSSSNTVQCFGIVCHFTKYYFFLKLLKENVGLQCSTYMNFSCDIQVISHRFQLCTCGKMLDNGHTFIQIVIKFTIHYDNVCAEPVGNKQTKCKSFERVVEKQWTANCITCYTCRGLKEWRTMREKL